MRIDYEEIQAKYKYYLIDLMRADTFLKEFYFTLIKEYLKDFNIIPEDIYSGIKFLQELDDDEIAGIGINDKAVYYLMEKNTSLLYWFISERDAVTFARSKDEYESGVVMNEYINFYTLHKKCYLEFWWLLPEDLDKIEEIKLQKKQIICVDNDLIFDSIDEILTWFKKNAIAKDLNVARRQLIKHLNGETNTCYKMKFMEW